MTLQRFFRKHSMLAAGAVACFVAAGPSALASEINGPVPTVNSLQATNAPSIQLAEGPQWDDDHHGRAASEWSIRSSVQLSRDVLRGAYAASREAYTDKLEKYAKCTPEAAKKAVLAAHPGMKVEDIQLRNIRTSLVYMAIAEDDQDKFFVVVDAGNKKILMDRPLPTHHERVFASH